MFYAKIAYEKDKKIQHDMEYLKKLKYMTEKLYLNNIYNNSNTDTSNLKSYIKNIYDDLIKKKYYFYKLKKFLIKNNLLSESIDVNLELKNIKKKNQKIL